MATIRETLNSDRFKNATKEQQAAYMRANDITQQDVFVAQESANPDYQYPEGYAEAVRRIPQVPQEEPGFIEQTGRSLKRGALQLLQSAAAIPLYDNFTKGAEDTGLDVAARKVYDYTKRAMEESPSLVTPRTGLVNQSFQSALESMPVSLAYGAPMLLGELGSIASAGTTLALSAASFEAMRRGTTVQQIDELKDRLKQKGIVVPDEDVIRVAKQQGLSEAGTELASDIITKYALKAIDPTKGIGATTAQNVLKRLFNFEGKETAKQLGKAYLGSVTGEASSEAANLAIQEKLGEQLGLENRTWEQMPVTLGSTLFMSGMMEGAGAVPHIRRQKEQMDAAKNILFNGVDDASQMTDEQAAQYAAARAKVAAAYAPIIKESLGEEAASNFLKHIKEQTNNAISPEIEDKGDLPFNASIFTDKLDRSQTIQPGQTSDMDTQSGTPSGTASYGKQQLNADLTQPKTAAIPAAGAPIIVEELTAHNIDEQRERATGIPSINAKPSVGQLIAEDQDRHQAADNQAIYEQQQQQQLALQEQQKQEAAASALGISGSTKVGHTTYTYKKNKDGSYALTVSDKITDSKHTRNISPVEVHDIISNAQNKNVSTKTAIDNQMQTNSAGVPANAAPPAAAIPVAQNAAGGVANTAPIIAPSAAPASTAPVTAPVSEEGEVAVAPAEPPKPKRKAYEPPVDVEGQSQVLKEAAATNQGWTTNKLADSMITALGNGASETSHDMVMGFLFNSDGSLNKEYEGEIKRKDAKALGEYANRAHGVLVEGVKQGVLDYNNETGKISLAEGKTIEDLHTWYNNLTRLDRRTQKDKTAAAKATSVAAELNAEDHASSSAGTTEDMAGERRSKPRKKLPKETISEINTIEEKINEIAKNESTNLTEETDKSLDSLIDKIDKLQTEYDIDTYKQDELRQIANKARILKAIRNKKPYTRLQQKIVNITKFFRNIKDAVEALPKGNANKSALLKALNNLISNLPTATEAREKMIADMQKAFKNKTAFLAFVKEEKELSSLKKAELFLKENKEEAKKLTKKYINRVTNSFNEQAKQFSVTVPDNVYAFIDKLGNVPRYISFDHAKELEAFKSGEISTRGTVEKISDVINDLVSTLEDKDVTFSDKRDEVSRIFNSIKDDKIRSIIRPYLDKPFTKKIVSELVPKLAHATSTTPSIETKGRKPKVAKPSKTEDVVESNQGKTTEFATVEEYIKHLGLDKNHPLAKQLRSRSRSFVDNIVKKVQRIFNIQTRDGKVQSNSAAELAAFLTTGKSVGASRSIPKEVTGFIQGISDWFKFKDKLFITTTADVQASKIETLIGNKREILTDDGKSVGFYLATSEGIGFIVLNQDMITDKKTLLRTITHEVSHAVIFEHWDNTSPEIQNKVINDFYRWFGEMQKGGDARAKALRELYQEGNKRSFEEFKKHYGMYFYGNIENLNQTQKQKVLLFEEYLAEQISKFIRERQTKPEGVIARFFSDLATKLRKVFSLYQREAIKYRQPVPSVSNWLDGLLESQRVSVRLQEEDNRLKEYDSKANKLREDYNNGVISKKVFKDKLIELKIQYNITDQAFRNGFSFIQYADMALPGDKTQPFNLLLDGSGKYINEVGDNKGLFTINSNVPETHFGEGNWVHIRGDQRETSTGDNVLHINELQSDWDKQYVKSLSKDMTDQQKQRTQEQLKDYYKQIDDLTSWSKSVLKDPSLIELVRTIEPTHADYYLKNEPDKVSAVADIQDLLFEANNNDEFTSIKSELESWSDELSRLDYGEFNEIDNRIQELEQQLSAQTQEIAPPPIEGKYWMQHAIKQIIRYANEKGLDTITFPSTPQQVADIEDWGLRTYESTSGNTYHFAQPIEGLKIDKYEEYLEKTQQLNNLKKKQETDSIKEQKRILEKEIRNLELDSRLTTANSYDVTSIIDRMINKVPRELERLAKEYGGKFNQVKVGEHTLNALTISPAMVRESAKFGPKYSKVSNDITKLTAMDKMHSLLERTTKLGRGALSYINLPFIQSLNFNKLRLNLIEDMVKSGMSYEEAEKKAIEQATKADKNGVTARFLFEQHEMDANKGKLLRELLIDDNGVQVYANAVDAYESLSDANKEVWNTLLYSGDANKVVYADRAEAAKAIGQSVSQNVFDTYLLARKAIDTVFKQGNFTRYMKVLDDIVGSDFTVADSNAIKSILTRNLNQKFTRNRKRFDDLRSELGKLNLSSKDIDTIISATKQVYRTARRALTFYKNGGIPGAIAHYRSSKADNPYVLRISENYTNPDTGKTTKRDRYVKFFNTEAEATAVLSRIKTDADLKSLFPNQNIDVNNFKDAQGNIQARVAQETDAQIGSMFPTRGTEKRIQESIINSVIDRLGEKNTSLDKDTINAIKKDVLMNATRQFMNTTNKRFLSRKQYNIEGFDKINPLMSAHQDAVQTASYVARATNMQRTMDFIGGLSGEKKVQALKDMKINYTKYLDNEKALVKAASYVAQTATISFMTYRFVTAATQAHQYFTFGMSEMVADGASPAQAARLLGENYWKLALSRSGVSIADFRKYLRSDAELGKLMRQVLTEKQFKYLSDSLESLAKKSDINTKNYLSKGEMEILERHRATNDVADNITRELNNNELAIREGVSNRVKDSFTGAIKAGMLLFSEMETLNREASLIAMYQFQADRIAKEKGTTRDKLTDAQKRVADARATDFMLRVNGDFNKMNKLKVMRQYPMLAPVFALTTFTFHGLGILGHRFKQGVVKRDVKSLKSMITMFGMCLLLGGLKGEPLWDQFNQLIRRFTGKDWMLDMERAAHKGADAAWQHYVIDATTRGILGHKLDWTNNISMRTPWSDLTIDLLEGKQPDVTKYGAALSWVSGVAKAGKRLSEGDIKRAIEDLNVGGISQVAKASRLYTEGYTKEGGAPAFFGTKQRTITLGQAITTAFGFRPTEVAKQADVLSSEREITNVYWKNKRENAIKDSIKLIDPYIKSRTTAPSDVREKIMNIIQKYNTDLIKANPEVRMEVKPFKPETLVNAVKNRYVPNKGKAVYERSYEEMIKENED